MKIITKIKENINDIKLLKKIIKNIKQGYKLEFIKDKVPDLSQIDYSTEIVTVLSTRKVIDIHHYFIIDMNEYYIILSKKEGNYESIYFAKYDYLKYDNFNWQYISDQINSNSFFTNKLFNKLENKMNKLMIDSELVENIIEDDEMDRFLMDRIKQKRRNNSINLLLK